MITKKISEIEIEIIDGDRGLNYPKEDEFSSSGFCLFLSAKNVTKEGFKIDNCQFITEYKDSLLGQGKLKRNDVILTTRGTVGNTAYYNERVVYNHIRINSGMVILRNNDNRIDNTYLVHFLSSPLFIQQINRIAFGSAQPQLTVKTINDISILFPKDINCQNHISKILNTFNFVLEQTQLTIAKYKNIKQGLLHDMFTRGLGANGNLRPTFQQTPELYKESELGMIPKEWEVIASAEIVRFINGRAYSIYEWETYGIPVIRLQNLTGSGDTYYYSNLKLPDDQYCNNGDLLYMWSASFGPHIWNGNKAIYHYHIWKVECSKRILQDYFYYDLLRFTETVLNGANGSTMAHITKEKMDKRLVLAPPITEQKEITKRIHSIKSEETLLSKYQSIKRGLMGDLLSGKKEV